MFLIILVYEVNDDFDHGVLFFGAAFGDHQSEGNEGVIGNSLGTVFIIKDTITIEEPQEQGGGNAFVAVTEGMVLGDKIQEHGGFLLN